MWLEGVLKSVNNMSAETWVQVVIQAKTIDSAWQPMLETVSILLWVNYIVFFSLQI